MSEESLFREDVDVPLSKIASANYAFAAAPERHSNPMKAATRDRWRWDAQRAIGMNYVSRRFEPFGGTVELLHRSVYRLALPPFAMTVITRISERDLLHAHNNDIWVKYDEDVAQLFALLAERIVAAPR